MPKVTKVNYVHCWCNRHNRTTEHVEYILSDNTVKYKCRECYNDIPYAYPLYGRQQPVITQPKKQETVFGRVVA